MTDGLNLLAGLTKSDPSVSLITTYNAWLPFYESVVLKKLHAAGCHHNVLLMDARQCARALWSSATRPSRSGVEYTLIPVSAARAFHPKIALVANRKMARLFVGSHNTTLAGFGGNAEASVQIDVPHRSDQDGLRLVHAALAFVRHWTEDQPEEVRRTIEAVADAMQSLRRPTAVDATRLFLGATRTGPSLWSQLREQIRGHVRRVVVVGPYFDEGAAFLRELRDTLQPEKMHVVLDAKNAALPWQSIERGMQFVDISGLSNEIAAKKRLHAKLVWIEADQPALIVGSANPTASAWLTGETNRNAEAVILLRGERAEEGVRALQLESLLEAPEITTTGWNHIRENHSRLPASITSRAGHGVALAMLSGERLLLPRQGFSLATTEVKVRLLDAELNEVATVPAYLQDRHFTAELADVADTLLQEMRFVEAVEPRGDAQRFLLHRVAEIDARATPGRQQQLRKLLGALDGDPSELDGLIKIVDAVIFDEEPVLNPSSMSAVHRGQVVGAAENATQSFPDQLQSATGATVRKSRSRAVTRGDLGMLLDAVIRRLGKGLSSETDSVHSDAQSESDNDAMSDEASGEVTEAAADAEASKMRDADLAALCRRKTSILCRRLKKQLDSAHSENIDARTVVCQTAAVLGLMHTLHRLERQEPWYSARHQLVSVDDQNALFAVVSAAFSAAPGSIAQRALEANGEVFEEHSKALGWITWLAREHRVECSPNLVLHQPGAAMAAAIDSLGRLAELAPLIADDVDAWRALQQALTLTRALGHNVTDDWFNRHYRWLNAVALAFVDPRGAGTLARPVRPGDLAYATTSNAMRPLLLLVREVLGQKAYVVELLREQSKSDWLAAADRRREYLVASLRAIDLEALMPTQPMDVVA